MPQFSARALRSTALFKLSWALAVSLGIEDLDAIVLVD